MEIAGFENYLIYDDGDVYSIKRSKFLKPKNNKGYQRVGLHTNGERKNLYIHRLVALHYIPNPYNKPQVDHIDGNKSNNHMNNLRWTTIGENGLNRTYKNNTSGHKGIFWRKGRNKWSVEITKDCKKYFNGHHTKLEDAVRARDQLVLDLGIEEYYRKE